MVNLLLFLIVMHFYSDLYRDLSSHDKLLHAYYVSKIKMLIKDEITNHRGHSHCQNL